MAVELVTFGQVVALRDGQAVDLGTRKHVALLAYLALNPGRDLPRARLARLFWAAPEARRLASLSQGLHTLRDTLGVELQSHRGVVRLPEGQVSTDAERFELHIQSGSRSDALDLYHGEFLPGLASEGSPDFERWAEGERARLHSLATISLHRLLDELQAAGRWDDVVTRASRWLRLFPQDLTALGRLEGALEELGYPREASALRDLIARLEDDEGGADADSP